MATGTVTEITKEEQAFMERLMATAIAAGKDGSENSEKKIKITGSVSFHPLTITVSVEF